MRHHRLSEWADFVRGIVSEGAAREMREHLATGCGRCRRAAASVRRMLELAKADAGVTPPAFAERSVKALFSLHQPERRSRLPVLRLRPSADDGLAPAGVRAARVAGQPAHYESEEYSLDLHLDVPAGTGEAVLSGQLLRQTGCFTGDLGDFQMAVGHPESSELWLLLDGGEVIAIDLGPGFAGPS